MDKKYTIEVSEYEINLILNALSLRPFREVVDIINKLITIRDSKE